MSAGPTSGTGAGLGERLRSTLQRRSDNRPRPPWCGQCEERSRLRDTDDGRAVRCSLCHPLLTPQQSPPARDVGQVLDGVNAAANDQVKLEADRIIRDAARAGQPFSANTLRERFDLAQVPTPLRGARIAEALQQGLIREVGLTRSSDDGTHGKRISLWVGTEAARR